MSILTLPEIKRELGARGFTHIRSMAGPIRLEDWTPYGKRVGADRPYRGEIVAAPAGDPIRVVDRPEGWDDPKQGWRGFVLGAWEPMRVAEVLS